MKKTILIIKVFICFNFNFIFILIIIIIVGNFKELCKLFSKYDSEFETMYLQKINLTSWKIQEELIQMCADQVKETILNQISNVGFFAIICDEAR